MQALLDSGGFLGEVDLLSHFHAQPAVVALGEVCGWQTLFAKLFGGGVAYQTALAADDEQLIGRQALGALLQLGERDIHRAVYVPVLKFIGVANVDNKAAFFGGKLRKLRQCNTISSHIHHTYTCFLKSFRQYRATIVCEIAWFNL